MLHVPDVELDPLVPRQCGAAVDLRPAGQARAHLEPPALARRVLLDLVAERRPRPDQAHLSAHDVPELRQLVDGRLAQHAADARDPAVACVDGVAGSLVLGPVDHRPQLQQLEVLAVLPNSRLPEEDRAAVLELDRDRGGGEQWADDSEPERCAHDIQCAIHSPIRRIGCLVTSAISSKWRSQCHSSAPADSAAAAASRSVTDGPR